MTQPNRFPAGEDIDRSAVPYTLFSGFCMGTADVVPGVSGGTMAVALGIYRQLLAAITSLGREALTDLVRLRLRRVFEVVHWRFLATLLTGIGLGIALMVKVVELPTMVTADSPHRPLVYAVFFGMVLGSTFTLGRHVEWNALRIASLLAGAAVGFTIVNLVPVDTPEGAWFIFLCGAVAICAMLLPGISGSFILLILGKYAYVLGAVGELDFAVIAPFCAGCLVGIVSFSRLLKWLLDRYRHTVMAVLVGLLFGTLWRIWPYQEVNEVVVRGKSRVIGATPFLPERVDAGIVIGFALGLAFVIAIEWYAVRRGLGDLAAASREAHEGRGGAG